MNIYVTYMCIYTYIEGYYLGEYIVYMNIYVTYMCIHTYIHIYKSVYICAFIIIMCFAEFLIFKIIYISFFIILPFLFFSFFVDLRTPAFHRGSCSSTGHCTADAPMSSVLSKSPHFSYHMHFYLIALFT